MRTRLVLAIGLLVYVVGSAADIYTTHIGIQMGFGEKTPPVRLLIQYFGSPTGIVIAKLVGLPVAVLVGYSFAGQEIRQFKLTKYSAVAISLALVGLYYLAVGIRNLLVIYG